MNSVTKVLTTGLAGGAALLSGADATAQDSVNFTAKPKASNEIRLTGAEVKELAGARPDLTNLLASKTTNSNADLVGRTRVGSVNENKITSADTPLAPTIEAIASEVAQYGLLQTRQEKLDFARKVQVGTNDNLEKGLKHAGKEGQFFLDAIKWVENSKRDSLFDTNNGYTRKRLISALVHSPSFEESLGSMFALAKGKTNVPFVTNFNEKLIRESKIASTTKPTDKDLVSINR